MKLHGNIITGKWNGNKYKVIGLLGKGGTGRVYKVLDMKSDSYYALKVSEDIQSITKESNMLNKFKHIGAIPKYIELDDYKEGGKTYYFIVIIVSLQTLLCTYYCTQHRRLSTVVLEVYQYCVHTILQ